MRERVKLKLSLLYCTVESVESVLGRVASSLRLSLHQDVEPTAVRRGIEPTSRHRALTLYATGAWSHCMSIEDASRCVEGSVELYIELYIEDVEASGLKLVSSPSLTVLHLPN